MNRLPQAVPFLLFGLNLVAYLGLAWTDQQAGTLRGPVVGQTVGWYLLAAISFLLACLWAERSRRFPGRWLWVGAILFRLLLLTTAPTLSDDVYRYLWDGHLVREGISPYQFAIEAPELDAVATTFRSQANNQWMASPYLPVGHLLFAAVAWLLPLKPLALQMVMVVLDLLTALLLRTMLRQRQLPDRRLLWYLWHPLLIIEVAHGAHLDIWMTLLALLAICFAFNPGAGAKSGWLSPFFLALATLTKIVPILLLPVLFWRWRWRDRFLFGALVLAILFWASRPAGWGLSGPLDGVGLFGALRIYTEQWQFNGAIYHWLQSLLANRLDSVEAAAWAKLIGYAGAGLGALWVWLASRQRSLPVALNLLPIPILLFYVFAATVAPWYLLLLIPLLALLDESRASRWLGAALLYLTLTVFFSYLIYLPEPGASILFELVRLGEWLPTLLLMFAWGFFGRGSRLNIF